MGENITRVTAFLTNMAFSLVLLCLPGPTATGGLSLLLVSWTYSPPGWAAEGPNQEHSTKRIE